LKVLAIDPGGIRQGYACVERPEDQEENKPPIYHGSGLLGVKRLSNGKKAEPYQEWRLRIIEFWAVKAVELLDLFKPDRVVSEIVPVVGGGNFVAATQSQLAATAVTTFQAIAANRGYEIKQIGATTVKAKIGGGKKATKVVVRNGVIKLIPMLADHKKEWTKEFEVPDALAVGLTDLGYSIG
jgi:Holliday junction resolvasome RuvABC endonuclease subunit